MKDKLVEKTLRTLMLSLTLLNVWCDEKYKFRQNQAIELLEDAIRKDVSKELLVYYFTKLEIIMKQPLPLKSEGIKPIN